MNIDGLLKRRKEVVDRHLLLETVAGSGHHPDDPAARERKGNGLPKLSDRVTALFHDGTYWLLAGDVGKIRGLLLEFYETDRKEADARRDRAAAVGLEADDASPQHRQARSVAFRIGHETTDVITLPSNEFNAVMYCLNSTNTPVVTAGVLG